MGLEEQQGREKRAAEESKLPIPVRQRVTEIEATKRTQHPEEEGSQAKFVKFDPNTEIIAASPKQPRTGLYSPTFAGDVSRSPAEASASRNVRKVVDELELYDEDELDFEIAEGSWGWELCGADSGFDENMVSISEEDQHQRGFVNEGAGPPEVSPEELAWLDAETMQLELERLRDLDVIGSVDAGVDLDKCIKLDTRLVRDWRFRDARCRRRARLVAREFRDGDYSSDETFILTTPLVIVKMLIVLSLIHGLAIASLDVGDAFLQVPQQTTVLIEIPRWGLQSGEHGNGMRFLDPQAMPTRTGSSSIRMEQVLHWGLWALWLHQRSGNHLQPQV